MDIINYLSNLFSNLLGINAGQNCLTLSQMLFRVVIVYTLGVLLVRIGKRRFLGSPTPLDVVLILMFGSVMSRAITGNVPFIPTLAAGCMLIFLHWLFSYLAFSFRSLGSLFKGDAIILVQDGKINWKNMAKHHISERDLLFAMRRNAQITDLSYVRLATLERNGEISIITNPQKPQIAEIEVKDGVQKVVLELHTIKDRCKIE